MADIGKNIRNIVIFPENCQETLLPSEPALRLPLAEMNVQVAGFSRLAEGYMVKRFSPETHIVIFTMEGAGAALSGTEMIDLTPGTVFVSPAGQTQYYHISGTHWMMFWFHLYDTPRWSYLKLDKARARTALNSGELLSAMRQHVSEHFSSLPNAQRLSQTYAEVAAVLLDRELSLFVKSGEIRTHGRLGKLWDNVYDNPKTQWTLGSLAKIACFSPFHLSRLCRSFYKTSPMRMVTKLRMRKAKGLLHSTNLTVEDIAERVGYSSPFAFSNAFKRECGLSPKMARRIEINKAD